MMLLALSPAAQHGDRHCSLEQRGLIGVILLFLTQRLPDYHHAWPGDAPMLNLRAAPLAAGSAPFSRLIVAAMQHMGAGESMEGALPHTYVSSRALELGGRDYTLQPSLTPCRPPQRIISSRGRTGRLGRCHQRCPPARRKECSGGQATAAPRVLDCRGQRSCACSIRCVSRFSRCLQHSIGCQCRAAVHLAVSLAAAGGAAGATPLAH